MDKTLLNEYNKKINILLKNLHKIVKPYLTKNDPKRKHSYRDAWESNVVVYYIYTLTKIEKEKVNALIKAFSRN